MTALIAALKDIWHLTIPYFTSKQMGDVRFWFIGTVRMSESRFAIGLLVSIVMLELVFSYVAKLFNTWYNQFYNSLQEKNFEAFKAALLTFTLLAIAHIILIVYKTYINQLLQIRWRRSMTQDFATRWLQPAQHYRMRFGGTLADNPDQRISEDIHEFVGNTMQYSIGLFGNMVRLGIFTVVLWGLSETFPMQSFGFSFNIPGYLVWVSLIYAVMGTIITHYIGRILVGIEFRTQRYEANFRFAMARMRENSEQIALLRGETAETTILLDRYAHVFSITMTRIKQLKRLNWFTSFFSQFSVIFPYIMLGPAYFFGAAKLGDMMQTASTFDSVQGGMTWFLDRYAELAKYRATVTRLTGFQQAMTEASQSVAREPHIATRASNLASLTASKLVVELPDGTALSSAPAFQIAPRDRMLLQGPSGSGKTTLLRALSGIWPFGAGQIGVPEGKTLLVMPQRSYLPLGTLRQALAYPGSEAKLGAGAIEAALADVGLGYLLARLDDNENWTGILSGGEQQRLGFARVLLMRPDFLMLDESTSNLDEASEAAMHLLMATRLPDAAILYVAHHTGNAGFFTRTAVMEMNASTGVFALQTSTSAMAAE